MTHSKQVAEGVEAIRTGLEQGWKACFCYDNRGVLEKVAAQFPLEQRYWSRIVNFRRLEVWRLARGC